MIYKDYKVEPHRTMARMYEVKVPSGPGTVPMELRGGYTTVNSAISAIDQYEALHASKTKKVRGAD